MPLSEIKVRQAKSKDKPYKLADSGGLFLLVKPSGGKWWRYKYRFAGKEKLVSLGTYPDVGLAEARERHAQARKALAAGNDPSEIKKEAKRLTILKCNNTFESVAREWYKNREHTWSPRYKKTVLSRLESNVFPKLASHPIADITASDLLAVGRIVESRDASELAHRVMQLCSQIFTYAIVTDRVERNPAADLRGALKPVKTTHHAYLKADDLPEYLKKLEAFDGRPQTRLALRVLLLTFVRTTELRAAEWKEIDFGKAEWRIPAERMKMKELHIVPLSHQAIAAFREMQEHSGNRQHVFPNHRKPMTFMSENAMLYALYRMGYLSRTTGHGFRATASTILNENGFTPDVIERQLAHVERNKIRAAYNHAQYLPERRKMMQWWADYIDRVAAKK